MRPPSFQAGGRRRKTVEESSAYLGDLDGRTRFFTHRTVLTAGILEGRI